MTGSSSDICFQCLLFSKDLPVLLFELDCEWYLVKNELPYPHLNVDLNSLLFSPSPSINSSLKAR